MDERMDITLRKLGSPDDKSAIKELKQAFAQLLPDSVDSAQKWVKGKGEREIAKAAEIKTRIYSAIDQIENNRRKHVLARKVAERKAQQAERENQRQHEEKMYKLRTERLKVAVDRLIRLREMGVQIEMEVIAEQLMSAIGNEDS